MFVLSKNDITLYMCCSDINIKENNIEYFGLQALKANIKSAKYHGSDSIDYRGVKLSVSLGEKLYNEMNAYWVFIGKVKTFFRQVKFQNIEEVENFDYNYNPFIDNNKIPVEAFQEKLESFHLIFE